MNSYTYETDQKNIGNTRFRAKIFIYTTWKKHPSMWQKYLRQFLTNFQVSENDLTFQWTHKKHFKETINIYITEK